MSKTYESSCHCRTVGWKLTTAIDPQDWIIRACQCSFCRAHGARCTSDPLASVEFYCGDPAAIVHYRFGLNTADFILCARCGVYLGGVMQTGDGAFTTSNVNTLITDVGRLREPLLMHYGAENEQARRQRRQQAWTPVAIMI